MLEHTSFIQYISDSLKGTTRSMNKDKLLVIDGGVKYDLFVLFDGVSTSENAVKCIDIAINYITENHKRYLAGRSIKLADLMYGANQEIISCNLSAAYSTYSAVYVSKVKPQYIISNMGDSRIYGISNQYLVEYTEDDSFGENTNLLNKCLGMKELKLSDFKEIKLNQFEKMLLICSDGFYHLMEANLNTFFQIFGAKRLLTMKRKLHTLIENYNSDDATYVILQPYV